MSDRLQCLSLTVTCNLFFLISIALCPFNFNVHFDPTYAHNSQEKMQYQLAIYMYFPLFHFIKHPPPPPPSLERQKNEVVRCRRL